MDFKMDHFGRVVSVYIQPYNVSHFKVYLDGRYNGLFYIEKSSGKWQTTWSSSPDFAKIIGKMIEESEGK